MLVLATRWSDGSFNDPHCVGVLTGRDELSQRYVVSSRLYRRIEPLTKEEGDFILEQMKLYSDRSDASIYDLLEVFRNGA